MKLTPGELYFIRERDKQTNEISRYVKIGLVKEKDDRASKERALEHQTGNPRELLIHAVVKTPAISEIENIVHGLFAPERVSGEWFDFSDAKLKEAITTAQELADEANLYEDEMRSAAKLAKQISSSEIIEPSTEALAWHGAFLRAEAISKYCNDFASSMKDIFRKKAEEKPESVQHFATFRERKDRQVFDATSFELAHPDLFQQFTKTTTRVAARLTWTRPKDFNRSIEVLNPELHEYGKALEPLIESARNGELSSETLHKRYLRILGFEAKASWQLEVAKANIQFLCSTHGGIDGICKWPRAEKVTKTFDEPAFIEAFPDIAKQFMVSESQTAALIIDPKQGY
jgi:hypothetical protein